MLRVYVVPRNDSVFPGQEVWEMSPDGRLWTTVSASEAHRIGSILKIHGRALDEVTEVVQIPGRMIPREALDRLTPFCPETAGKRVLYQVIVPIRLDEVRLEPVPGNDRFHWTSTDGSFVSMIARAPDLETLAKTLSEHGIKSCLHTEDAVLQ